MNNVYVLSDIHMGTGQPWSWFKKTEQAGRLVSVLQEIANHPEPETVDLVFAGDVFDTWLTPPKVKPIHVQDILKDEDHQEIYKAINQCVEKCNAVYYMNGNHDMHVTAGDLAGFAQGGKKLQYVEDYPNPEIHIQHGHQFSMINAKDMVNSPEDGGLPLGYYITRMCAEHEDFMDHPEAIWKIIKQLFESWAKKQSFTQFLLEGLAEAVDMQLMDTFLQADGTEGISVQGAIERYENLFDQWVEKHPPGHTYADHSVLLELGSLKWFADYIFRQKGEKFAVAVMGHTHDDAISAENLFPSGVYANSGCWVKTDPSYVQIQKLQYNYQVDLCNWHPDKNKFVVSKRLTSNHG